MFSSGGQLKFKNDVIIPSSRLEPSSLFVRESPDSERFDDKTKFDCDQDGKMSFGLTKASSALGRIVECCGLFQKLWSTSFGDIIVSSDDGDPHLEQLRVLLNDYL